MIDKVALLKKQDILKGLSVEAFEEISRSVIHKKFSQGEIVMHEGDNAENIHFITKGVIAVYNIVEDGTIVPITLLHEGQSVGEMAAITHNPRSASVEALSDVETLAIALDAFDSILKSHAVLVEALLKDLSNRLLHENKIVQIRQTERLPEKAWVLLQALAPYFKDGAVDISHEKLAELAGATRPRVTEALHSLSEEGKISLSFNHIRVLENRLSS